MLNHDTNNTDHSWDKIWCAIPAFNEAATIRPLIEKLLTVCPRVIVIDDSSTDGTAQQLADLPIVLLSHDINRGKADCLRRAFEYAANCGATAVVTLDGDGQHDPADARRLLAIWKRNPDRLIIGARLQDQRNFPKARYFANRIACFWISWAAGHPIADTQSGFRVYPRSVTMLVLNNLITSSRFTFESEVLIEAARSGVSTLAVTIPGHYPSHARPSHFRPIVDITKIVLMVAKKLLQRGMSPIGLYRSLKPALVIDKVDTTTLPELTTRHSSHHE